MGRRKRRRRTADSTPATATPEVASDVREKAEIVPWRQRAREIIRRLREFARDRAGTEIEVYLRRRFGDAAATTPVAELERAFDDYVCAPGTPEDGRSLVRMFAEETEDLEAEERRFLPLWESERRRGVFLLDQAHRDQLVLWDPLHADRVTMQLLERLPRGRVAGLERGAVVLATIAPLEHRVVALGEIELYDSDDAIKLFRQEVREQGRVWHDLPKPLPT